MMWVIFALLTGAAVFSVLWPLSRAPAATEPHELDVAFYKAQAAEIERDSARGVIGPEEAEVARTEAARRLVAARHTDADERRQTSPWVTRIAALGAIAFVPALAFLLYPQIGAPGMPDAPLQARLDAAPAKMDIAAAIGRIEQHLQKNPDDGKGWTVLAPIYMRLQRYDDAQRAFGNVIRVLGPSAERYAELGEAQMYAGDGAVTPEAKHSFEQAVKLDPNSPRGGFYLGLAAEQGGDKAQAVKLWTQLADNSPPNAPWLPTIRAHIAEAKGEGPPPDAGAASPPQAADGTPQGPMASAVRAMAPDQQQAMIHRMVDGLAARLKSNGNDIEGWLRLVRAYRVLNEADRAKVALTDARRTFAADPDATKRLDALAHELGLES